MKSYILSIVVAAIVCAIVRGLLDEKTTAGQMGRLLCGIFMAITMIAPISNISFENISGYFRDLTLEANQYAQSGKIAASDSMKSIIMSQTEAYILDKADSLGLKVSVEVELGDQENMIPNSVLITGKISPYAKEVLSEYIEDTLGIAKENQKWK